MNIMTNGQHKQQNDDSVPGVSGAGGPGGRGDLARDPSGLPGSPNIIGGREMLKILFWVVLVVAIGMVAVNQTFEFYYKAEFLRSPCSLCMELNPEVSEQCFIKGITLYPYGSGDWADSEGQCYDSIGNKKNCSGSSFYNTPLNFSGFEEK